MLNYSLYILCNFYLTINVDNYYFLLLDFLFTIVIHLLEVILKIFYKLFNQISSKL